MKTLFYGILLFLLVFTAKAQNTGFTDAELEQLGLEVNQGSTYLRSVQRDVKGDPYLNEELLKGFIQVNERAKTEELFLRYNMAENMLEFARGEQLYVINSNKIQGFTLYGSPDNLVFRKGYFAEEHDIKPDTFLRIIYDGDVKLVAHHTTSLKKDIPTYGSATKKDEYVDDTDFFIIDQEGGFYETGLKRKDIIKRLDKDKTKELMEYVNEHNLDFENETDLKQILKFYDRIKTNS